MPINVQIRLVGKEETLKDLKRAGVQLTNFSAEFRRSGEFLVDFYSRVVFETQGQIIGETWPKLSPSYEFDKRIKFPGRGILVATGDLQKSIRAVSSATFLRVFTPTDYAKFHQLGTVKMAQRIFMKLDKQRVDAVVTLLEKGLLARIKSAIS